MSFESGLKQEVKWLREEVARNTYEKEKTQKEECEDAFKENRQPRCVHCGNPLDRVGLIQETHLLWEWDRKQKKYVQTVSDEGLNDPMCGHCFSEDWDFTDNKWITY